MPLRHSSLPVRVLRSHPTIYSPISQFHTSTAWKNDSTDHYSTLGLQPNASQAAIKKQFYSLSKIHHPDHNPDDPHASTRFVQISEAYHILGSPAKRERYDRENHLGASSLTPNRSSSSTRRGSYSSSSASTHFGARPASGLSKRRTQFHGPPPSFYRSGGWGAQGTKRQAQADAAASAAADAAAGSASFGAGMSGWDANDVPHFDREGHFRTQEQQQQRRRRKRVEEESADYGTGRSMIINFAFVSGILSMACFLPAVFEKKAVGRSRDEG